MKMDVTAATFAEAKQTARSSGILIMYLLEEFTTVINHHTLKLFFWKQSSCKQICLRCILVQ